jgi:2,4-dienoyl-CoA reductase [(3E)-enoyl-CoA-producing], peroxisomal
MARTDSSPFRSDVLEGRVALVTGGATGLGLETCRVLGRHGARVALCSRKESNLAQAVASLREEGIDAMYSVCDVRQAGAVAAAVQSVLPSYGRLDLLVNNAAGNFPALIADLSPNGFKAVVDIDLLGTFNVSKAVYEGWMRDHGGAVVNITAATQYRGMAQQSHVVAAKAAIDAFSRTCAIEWGPNGVRVNVVAPGGMSGTEGVKRIAGGDKGSRSAQNPLKRLGTTTEIAQAILFLASDAASYITGATLVVDGGGWLTSAQPAGRGSGPIG